MGTADQPVIHGRVAHWHLFGCGGNCDLPIHECGASAEREQAARERIAALENALRELLAADIVDIPDEVLHRLDELLASPDAATPAELSSTLDVERRVREMIEAGTLPKNACPGCGCTPDRRWTETWINSSNHDKVIRAGSCHVHGHQCSEYARLSTPPASSETPGEAQG